MKIGSIIALFGFLIAFASLLPDDTKMPAGAVILLFALCTIIANIQMASPEHAKRLCDDLEQPSYKSLYNATLEKLLCWAFKRADIAEPEGDESVSKLFSIMLTHSLLNYAMLFAVLYPIVLLLLPWAMALRPMSLGNTQIIAAPASYWQAFATLAPLGFYWLTLRAIRWAAASPQRFGQSFAGWLIRHDLDVTVALALALAGAGAGALAGAGAGAVAGALAGAVALAGAGAVALAGAGAVAVLGAFFWTYESLHENRRYKTASTLVILFPVIGLIVTARFVDFSQLGEQSRMILVFFGFAPIINAVFDTLSYAITLALSARGHRGYPLFWGLLDAACACLLFIALGATFVVAISLFERLSGSDLIDLGGLLAQAGDFGQYWWLYAMLFSTALPTLLHLLLATLSLQNCAFFKWRISISSVIKTATTGDDRANFIASLALGTIWGFSILLVFTAISGLVYLIWGSTLTPILTGYRDILLWVALHIGGL